MIRIDVTTSKAYPVWIGRGLLSQAGEMISSACGGEAAFIVTDDTVDGLYGDVMEQSLSRSAYTTSRYVFPHGEASKNTDTYVALLAALAQANLSRSDVIVALGGGVVGDLAGFAAATYLRGIPYVQIPTTLLSMVDSSVGGKTAVDLPAGKNLAGAFYQPDMVLCDCDVLATLPDDVFQDGCAEMIKHGAALDAELFALLKEPILPQIEDIIARNIRVKRDLVVVDERDTGIRQILNFGHTIGHGIETHSNYSVSHGKAVAIGMVIASRGAYRVGLCEESCHTEIVQALTRYGLPTETDLTPEKLIEAAFYDKKRRGQLITLILPERIGKCAAKSFRMDELASFIHLGMET